MAGIATGADFIFIPERPPVVGKWEKEMLDVIERVLNLPKRLFPPVSELGAMWGYVC